MFDYKIKDCMFMKRTVSLILSIIILSFGILSQSIQVEAYSLTNKQEQIQEQVKIVAGILREQFEDQLLDIENEITDIVCINGYDYSLTMDTFYNQPNPLRNIDYIKYLATYMSCKKFAQENGLYIHQLTEINFLSYTIEELKEDEYIPTEVDKYVVDVNDNSKYKKQGTRFIVAPEEVPLYSYVGKGQYEKTKETIYLEPNVKTVEYLNVTLISISPRELADGLGIDIRQVEDDIAAREDALNGVVTNESISEGIFMHLPNMNITADYTLIPEDISDVRRLLLMTAISLTGKVPYEWGGKASAPGIDCKWWTYNPANGLQHGLDCSGFVQWSFMTAGFDKDIYSQMISTSTILGSSLREVSQEDLRPGDIGVTNRSNGAINHTGIYLGDNKWIHCSSAAKTVTVSEFNFTRYFNPFFDMPEVDIDTAKDFFIESKEYSPEDTEIMESADNHEDEVVQDAEDNTESLSDEYTISESIDLTNSIYYTFEYSEEDVLLLAKLMYNEANSEGLNGQVAVGEVVLNRIASDSFPNTLSEVIYQPGQFSNSGRLSSINPSDELIQIARMVLSGNMKVLNNSAVLYFKNPMITDGISADTNADWGKHKWYTSVNHHAFYI